jgi:hypothetical protein
VAFSAAGVTLNSTTYVSATSLTANITIAAGATTGANSATLTNGDGSSATKASAFTVNAAPTVTSAAPSSRGQGAASQNITITGTNFESGASVSFSAAGVAVNSTTYVSATSLTANITIAAGATTGANSVTVTNADHSVATGTGVFTVNAGPSVTSTSPSAGDRGATAFNVTITGTNFVSGASVAFSGTGITLNSTTFNSSTQLTANITIASNATTGSRNVTVTNPDAGVATGTGVFTVNAAPTVTSAAPAAGDQGATNFNVTVTGTNFVNGPGLAVAFSAAGVTLNSTTYVSATSLTANITIAAGATTGANSATLTNGDGSSATKASAFTVNAAPTVTSPTTSSPVHTGLNQQFTVTVTGTSFENGLTVTIPAADNNGNYSVNTFTWNSSTSIGVTVTGNAGSNQTSGLTVTNPDGSTVTCTDCLLNGP